MKKNLLSLLISILLLVSFILPKIGIADDVEETGYWERTGIIDKPVDESQVERTEYYSNSWTYGHGNYAYKSVVTFDGSGYIARNHDSCKGEYVTSTGTSSSPASSYLGDESVVLNLSIKAETSKNICYHLGASMWAYITPVNKDDPFASYGSDTSFWDVNSQLDYSWISTYKNDTNTGYHGMSAPFGATIPRGSKEGDKVYIVLVFSGGNERMETAYEYTWHKSGAKEAIDLREENKRQEKEKLVLETWKDRYTYSSDKMEKADPRYEDSGIRVNRIWGQVMIRRWDEEDDECWEYLTQDMIIY